MKYKALIILLVAFSLLIPSCEKCFNDKIWAYCNERGCASFNPWGHAERDNTEFVVIDFLHENNILVFDIKIEIYFTGPFCMACHCPTGRRIHVLIRESDVEEIKRLGFQL